MQGQNEEAFSGDRLRRDLLKFFLGAGLTALAPPLSFLGCTAPPPETPPNRPGYAVGRFLKSMNCSQAVLETYGPALGMPALLARRVAAALAGGMGLGSECGAVTGAILVIGLKYGKTTDSDHQADKATFQRVAALCREFQTRHGHLGCSQLLGVDMGSPEGVQEDAKLGLFTKKCPEYVRSAAEILDTIL
ncbi:MAG: C-GCAxxG-C-C family protein [Syntrophales bacterium]|nr:C-GCAxxG-C-C family protein [Syntrophales bacterium]MDD5642428.1 C-GCAxxG-C-C family protein [Syntrophales bacterium]